MVILFCNAPPACSLATPHHSGREVLAQQRVLEAVDQRLQAGFDDVLVDADRPHSDVPSLALDEHARPRRRAGRRVDDADFVVGQADVLEVAVELDERGAQRGVERVHRAVAFGNGVRVVAARPRTFTVASQTDAVARSTASTRGSASTVNGGASRRSARRMSSASDPSAASNS